MFTSLCAVYSRYSACAVCMCVQLTHYNLCVQFAQKFFPLSPEYVQFTYARLNRICKCDVWMTQKRLDTNDGTDDTKKTLAQLQWLTLIWGIFMMPFLLLLSSTCCLDNWRRCCALTTWSSTWQDTNEALTINMKLAWFVIIVRRRVSIKVTL